MNAGFSSLTKLKSQLLAASMRDTTEYNDAILAIGRGIAKQFEHDCNRQFAWTVNDQAVFSADRTHYFLPRYPFTTISRIEIRNSTSNNQWQDLGAPSATIINQDEETGYIFFGGMRGPSSSLLRVTYTGGFWWDTTEDDSGTVPTDPSDPTKPAATLHEDFILGWLTQCRHVWRLTDELGVGISKDPEGQDSDKKIEMLPFVKSLIDDMVRYQLT